MDGEFAHPDIATAAIMARPIARLEYLLSAVGICRFKVVPVDGVNAAHCGYVRAAGDFLR